MTNQVKKNQFHESHHEPSSNGGTMNVHLDLESISTIKLDGSSAPFVGVFSYTKKKKKSKKFYYYIPIFLQKVGYTVFFILHKIFVKIEVRGRENLTDIDGPIILASNHTGELDVTIMPLVFPFISKFYPIYYLTNPSDKYRKSNNFGWRSYIYGGKFFDLLGGCPIYSGRKNYAISLKNHINLLKKGNTVCIFPEGSITLDGKIGPARGGLGYLVYATGATVVPIAINSFFNISWTDYFLFRRKVIVTICKPMTKEELVNVRNHSAEDFRSGSKKVLDRINEVMVR